MVDDHSSLNVFLVNQPLLEGCSGPHNIDIAPVLDPEEFANPDEETFYVLLLAYDLVPCRHL